MNTNFNNVTVIKSLTKVDQYDPKNQPQESLKQLFLKLENLSFVTVEKYFPNLWTVADKTWKQHQVEWTDPGNIY